MSNAVAVAAGGALGALARYGLAEWAPDRDAVFPFTTLAINIAGSFLLGIVLTASTRLGVAWLRPFAGIGLLGGFTTYSAFAVQTVRLVEDGRVWAASAYLQATVFGAVVAVWLGMAIAQTVVLRRAR